MMKTYRGVVRGGVVELLEPGELAEGAEVEVRPLGNEAAGEAEREEAFEEALVRSGFLTRRASVAPEPTRPDWQPVAVEGQPLSETIIRERGRDV